MVNELQANLLAQLTAFDALCREHSVKYSLHGGTLLGAVRHKGFIPWDDDADIAMTRSEFKKLDRVLNSESYSLALYMRDRVYPKINYRRSTNVGPKSWIDVMIYDSITEKKFLQKAKVYTLAVLSAMNRTAKTIKMSKYERYNYLLRFTQYACYAIGCIIPSKWKARLHQWCCEYLLTGRKELIHRANDQYCGIGSIYPKEIMDSYTYVAFEDVSLSITLRYHDVLVSAYGEDYMIPKKLDDDEAKMHDMYRSLIEEEG